MAIYLAVKELRGSRLNPGEAKFCQRVSSLLCVGHIARTSTWDNRINQYPSSLET